MGPSNRSSEQKQIFRSNTLMIIVPGLCFGTALILRNQESLQWLMWILLAIGVLTTIALLTSFTTLSISDQTLSIKNLKKNHLIHLTDIAKKDRSISTSKGIESIVWKLHLKSGETLKISSDLFKEKVQLKESLDEFLKNIPKK